MMSTEKPFLWFENEDKYASFIVQKIMEGFCKPEFCFSKIDPVFPGQKDSGYPDGKESFVSGSIISSYQRVHRWMLCALSLKERISLIGE